MPLTLVCLGARFVAEGFVNVVDPCDLDLLIPHHVNDLSDSIDESLNRVYQEAESVLGLAGSGQFSGGQRSQL